MSKIQLKKQKVEMLILFSRSGGLSNETVLLTA